MPNLKDVFLTALAPTIWGSSYIITTEFLPDGYPVTAAMLRALPAGLMLLLIVRQLPQPALWVKILLLGALNFSLFWTLLFVAAYHLPGGVAATVGALQPLMVIFLANVVLKSPVFALSVVAALSGIGGVALLVLTSDVSLDTVGLVAAAGGALSMAAGTVLSRKWQPPVSALTFTAWQLTAGGALLLPVAFLMEPPLPPLDATNVFGFVYLGLIGAALTYVLWFRGVSRLEPSAVSALGFLSPASALLLGWFFLDQRLGTLQITGLLVVLASVWLSQMAGHHFRINLPFMTKEKTS
ncbi:MAG: EamA family transporter [Stappiaceae bacterium]